MLALHDFLEQASMASEAEIFEACSILERLAKGARVLPQIVSFVCVPDKFGQTASDLAGEAGHDELCTLLQALARSLGESRKVGGVPAFMSD